MLPFCPQPVPAICGRFSVAVSYSYFPRQPAESKKENAICEPEPESRGFWCFGDRVALFDVARPNSADAIYKSLPLCYRNWLPKRQPANPPVVECDMALSTDLRESDPCALFPFPTNPNLSKQCIAEIILSFAGGEKQTSASGPLYFFPNPEFEPMFRSNPHSPGQPSLTGLVY
jgi:hypothetical protein